MDKGAWRATVHQVANSQARLKRLSMHTLILTIRADDVGSLAGQEMQLQRMDLWIWGGWRGMN